jgi:hypothetical protein
LLRYLMHMNERPNPSLTSEHILHLKGEIFSRWEQLPPEHQATVTLIMLSHLVEGEYGPWTLSAMEMLWKEKSPLYSKTLPIPQISQADLAQTNLTAEEIAQLSEDDLRRITHDVSEHFANDVFWEEIEFIARLVLAERSLHPPNRSEREDADSNALT